jgi:YfiH family protein
VIPLSHSAALDGIPHAITSRLGGISAGPFASLNFGYATADLEENVAANRRAVQETLGIDPERTLSGWLTHGSAVSEFHQSSPDTWPVLRRPTRAGSARSEAMFRSDGVVSDVPGLHFILTFADCVPILFADRRGEVIGAAHAGWRGTAAGIATAVVRTMCDSYDCRPEDIQALIGPSIGPCCYIVGDEVALEFARHGNEAVTLREESETALDLWESNRRQLVAVGLRRESVEMMRVCTGCNTDRYFSHRVEGGVTGRFAAIIGLA